MRRVPIRAKVGAVLTVPLLALLIFSGVEVRQAARYAGQVRHETDLARAAVGPTGIISRLQDERTWATIDLVGMHEQIPVTPAGYGPTRTATDEAIRAFREDIQATGGAVETIYREALADLDELAAVRDDVDASTTPRTFEANLPFVTEIYDRYSALIHGMLDANAFVPLKVRDSDLSRGIELTGTASQQVELNADLTRLTVITATSSPNGIDTSSEIAAIASRLAKFDRYNDQLLSATSPYEDIVDRRFPREYAERLQANVAAAMEKGSVDDVQSFLDDVGATPEDLYPGLRDALSDEVVRRADDLSADARNRQRLLAVLAIVTLVGATVTTWIVSLSITRPLEALTRQARDMAHHRLPEAVGGVLETPIGEDVRLPDLEPITATTHDEIAHVAATLNALQDAAVGLAVEQAVLRRNISDSFLNLGRRNQNLLARQLDFITELESRETNHDVLASLYQLDHLATRMRRNAESLLVLAGVEPPRKWGAPVPLVDVIRAAVGEVEDYQRVLLQRVEPATVAGSTATDLAHLLAELVENGLVFSPPDRPVEVRGWDRSGAGSAGSRYTIAVIDWGVGLSPDDTARANRRLAGAESFTVAPSKYLGHYVAGTLASRHGIRITLASAGQRGTVATVDLPGLLTDASGAPPTAPRFTEVR